MAKIEITVDYSRMEDKGGIGIVVTIGDALYTKTVVTKSYQPTAGELLAVQQALYLIPVIARNSDKVVINSDQLTYVQRLMSNKLQYSTDYKKFKNRPAEDKRLIIENNKIISKLLEEGYNLRFKYSKSHSNNHAHNVADIYASTAAGKTFSSEVTPEVRVESHKKRKEWLQKYTGQFKEQPYTVWDYFTEQVSLLCFNLGAIV